GGDLEGDAVERSVVIGVDPAQLILDPGHATAPRGLADKDGRLRRLDLAEEEPAVAIGVQPVVEQSAGGRADAPVASLAPESHLLTNAVDEHIGPHPVSGHHALDLELGLLPLR